MLLARSTQLKTGRWTNSARWLDQVQRRGVMVGASISLGPCSWHWGVFEEPCPPPTLPPSSDLALLPPCPPASSLGLAPIASALAVELVAALMQHPQVTYEYMTCLGLPKRNLPRRGLLILALVQHPQGVRAPAPLEGGKGQEEEDPVAPLGPVPHMIRGSLAGFSQVGALIPRGVGALIPRGWGVGGVGGRGGLTVVTVEEALHRHELTY